MSLTVCKFGGSSLADAGKFKNVCRIVKSDPARRIIIPSAPGRRFPGDEKVTDLLYRAYEANEEGGNAEEILSVIHQRYEEIILGLGLNLRLNSEFDSIRAALKMKIGKDYFASRGEYLCGIILSNLLGFEFIDPADYFFFGESGAFDHEKTLSYLSSKLTSVKNAVIPGFYGTGTGGWIKTFPRGGSDITGAIAARSAKADLYENWTDVTGVLTADPRIIPEAKTIPEMSYEELRELSFMGATVLHEDAVFPARTANIPINIKNTFSPDEKGTVICTGKSSPVCGITGKRGYISFTVKKENIYPGESTLGKISEVLRRFGTVPEKVFADTDSVTVFAKEPSLSRGGTDAVILLKDALGTDDVFLSGTLSLISAVGGKNTAENAAQALGVLSERGIPVRFMNYGTSGLSFLIAVNDTDFSTALKAVHTALCGER